MKWKLISIQKYDRRKELKSMKPDSVHSKGSQNGNLRRKIMDKSDNYFNGLAEKNVHTKTIN